MGGLTDIGAAAALVAVLPAGTNVYVGLFTVLPVYSGSWSYGTEATGSGYARKAWSSWTGVGGTRINNGAIEFAALSAALNGIVGWGIWSAASGGNLLAFGPILDSGYNEATVDFPSGDQPRFPDGELSVGIS